MQHQQQTYRFRQKSARQQLTSNEEPHLMPACDDFVMVGACIQAEMGNSRERLAGCRCDASKGTHNWCEPLPSCVSMPDPHISTKQTDAAIESCPTASQSHKHCTTSISRICTCITLPLVAAAVAGIEAVARAAAVL